MFCLAHWDLVIVSCFTPCALGASGGAAAEEDDARIYRLYAERLRASFPASAAVFDGMAAEEDGALAETVSKERDETRDEEPRPQDEREGGRKGVRLPRWSAEVA